MYKHSLASILSQFGKTDLDFNLSDDEGIMPDTRVSRTVDIQKITKDNIDTIGQEICTLEDQNFITNNQEKENVKIEEETKATIIKDLAVLVNQRAIDKKANLNLLINDLKIDDKIKENIYMAIKELETSLVTSLTYTDLEIKLDTDINQLVAVSDQASQEIITTKINITKE
jgi:hypothetical protein